MTNLNKAKINFLNDYYESHNCIGWTLERLSELLEVSIPSLKRWEKGGIINKHCALDTKILYKPGSWDHYCKLNEFDKYKFNSWTKCFWIGVFSNEN
jgi:hypothetical protein